jgi:hypothetical protein
MVPTVLALLCSTGIVVAARRQGWGWAAPMVLYCAIWTAAIGLYDLRLFPFVDLAPSTWVAIALAGVAFVGGTFLGGRASARPNVTVPPAIVATVMRVYLLAGLTGAAWYLWQVEQALGIDALANRAFAVHAALTARVIPSTYLFLYYLGIAGAILAGYLVIVVRRQLALIDLGLLSVFTLAMATYTERTHLLWVLGCWGCLLLAPPRDRSVVRLAGAGVALVTLGLAFYLAVGAWLGKSPANLSNNLVLVAALADPRTPPDRVAALRAPGATPDLVRDVPAGTRLRALLPGGVAYRISVLYMSIAATLPTLDYGLTHHPRSWGQLTFRPFVRPLIRIGLVRDVQSLTTYDDVPTPYPANAYGYLYEHVRDFGLLGAVIFPAGFGWLAGWIYRRVQAGAGYDAVWLAMLHAMILWSSFRNHFVSTVSLYLVVALLVPVGLAWRRAETPVAEAVGV